ncbi:tyrosine-type recombinase/integrase [Phenylobacterium soli]|uniref:tyrosine-type recombinase/integrase n=1 Tax=Phenylobacterium soli TaxID=2170551 RepID=UPI001D042F36|nr:site-specific integrase [Phenylobacterium soli]
MADGEPLTLMDGKLHVYRRENSRYWQCSTYLDGRNLRQSTRQENLALAAEFARDWYMDRYTEHRVRSRGGEIVAAEEARLRRARLPGPKGRSHTFKEAAEGFLAEYQVLTFGERNAVYVEGKGRHVRLRLEPFFGRTPLHRMTAGRIQAYRVSRMTPPEDGDVKDWRPPARSTLHQELVTLRQILKWANRQGWIHALPDMSAPYRQSGKVSHRAWFSPEEYKRLYEATRERARAPKAERWRAQCEKLHDYVLFMANTGLRPDEASRLQFRDVSTVTEPATGERILQIEVRGKRGVGYCKSMPGAVLPFERLATRGAPAQSDLIFGKVQRELFNTVLGELGLKHDREGNVRTAYSLRHTYICLRLMEGADIYQIAKNCRTSVEMIEKFYAAHIASTIDAAAVNVRKAQTRPSRAWQPSATKAPAAPKTSARRSRPRRSSSPASDASPG